MIELAHAGGRGGGHERGRVDHTHCRMSLRAMMHDAKRQSYALCVAVHGRGHRDGQLAY